MDTFAVCYQAILLEKVAERSRKLWLTILLGLLLPAGNAVAQVSADSIAVPDSVYSIQSVPSDSISAPLMGETVAEASDTVPARRKNDLDAPVIYESADSMVWNNGGYASLYGEGKVNYQNVELTAAVIKMQMDSSLVHADGVRDSSGSYMGTPVFKDGSTPYQLQLQDGERLYQRDNYPAG